MQPDFAAKLRQEGYRATPGRIRLLTLLWQAQKPLTVAQLERRLRGELNTVTLYRALESLSDAGLLLRGSDGQVARYSYPEGHHHHMVCSDCGFLQLCRTC